MVDVIYEQLFYINPFNVMMLWCSYGDCGKSLSRIYIMYVVGYSQSGVLVFTIFCQAQMHLQNYILQNAVYTTTTYIIM